MSIEPHISPRGITDSRNDAPGTILCEIAVQRRLPLACRSTYHDKKHKGTLDLRQIGPHQVQLTFWHEDGGLLWQEYYPTRDAAEEAAWRKFNVQPSDWAKEGRVPSATRLRLRKLWDNLRRRVAALLPFTFGDPEDDETPKGCLTYEVPLDPDETPSGIECDDPELLRLAYAAQEALDDDRLDEGKQLVDQLIATYPDCLWGYELYDLYLIYSRDLYAPENRIDVGTFLKESIRNLERMLALNPKDLRGVYFAWSQYESSPLHLQLALHHCDAAWEAGSHPDAQAALEACRRHLAAWTADENSTFPGQAVRIAQAEYIEILCASATDAWTKTGGRPPSDAEKMPAIDDKTLAYINCELRWPWKAGLVPNITYKRAVCEDSARLRLTHAVWESLVAGRHRRGKRLLDTLIATYPDCVWGYELYDCYIGNPGSYAGLKEKIRNLERMLALNPDGYAGQEGYFEADMSVHETLKRCACDANWEAPTEAEAREMQDICLRVIDAELTRLRARRTDPNDYIFESVDRENNVLVSRCAAVMTAWAEAGGRVPSHDDKCAAVDRKKEPNTTPCRVLELRKNDIALVDRDGTPMEVFLSVDDVAVGDFIAVDPYRDGIAKLDPETAMAMLAEREKNRAQ